MSETIATGSTSVVFPSEGFQVLSTLVHLLGCSVLSFCFARRLEWTSLSKFCTMAIFFDSWLFLFSGGIVVSGIGMSLNDSACLSGVYICIVFYGTSKMLIYVFLSEKVHIVWSAGTPIRRFQSRIWIICAVVLLGYVVIFVLMLIGRIGYLQAADSDGRRTCMIGLEPMASIPLLSYDVFLNVFLTALFAYPLLGGPNLGNHVRLQDGRKLVNPKLRALAKRTCYAAGVALGTSVVNILILTILHGRQLGWVCLASCGFDVTVNAIVIFLITSKVHGDDLPAPKPRAALDKESNMPNHVILTRHLGITDDLNTTSTPENYVNHGAAFNGGGGSAGGGYGAHKQGELSSPPKHRKTLSFPKSPQGISVVNTKRTKPSAGQNGGYGNGSELDGRGTMLSQIGDFATTRDDGNRNGTVSVPGADIGVVSSVGSLTEGGSGGAGWSAGFRTSRSKKDQRNDNGKNGAGAGAAGGNAVQMVPVLLHGHGRAQSTSSFSLDDLKAEDMEPHTPNSVAKVQTFGGDD